MTIEMDDLGVKADAFLEERYALGDTRPMGDLVADFARAECAKLREENERLLGQQYVLLETLLAIVAGKEIYDGISPKERAQNAINLIQEGEE